MIFDLTRRTSVQPATTNISLVATSSITVPAQTSAAQTLTGNFADAITRQYGDPLVVHAQYTGTTPSAPSKNTLIDAWYLISIHSNASWYIYALGAWGALVTPDDSIIVNEAASATVTNQLAVQYIQEGKIAFTLKATNNNGTAAEGNWDIEVYKLAR